MSKTPRFTDSARWPNGYRKAAETNIAATFKRVRAEQKAAAEQDARNEAAAAEQAERDEAERKAKLRPMVRATTGG